MPTSSPRALPPVTQVSEARPSIAPAHACIVAGTHSGCGKTTITLGLMAALSRRGHVVQPYKAGPDFIDPGHHTAATGRPSINLDGWMCGPQGVRVAFARGLHASGARPWPHDLFSRPSDGNAPPASHTTWERIWTALGHPPGNPAPLLRHEGGTVTVATHAAPACGVPPLANPPSAHGHTVPDIAIIEGVMGLHDGASATTCTGSTAELALLLDLPVVLVIRARGMARSAAAMAMGYAALEPGLRIAGVICNEVGGPGHREMLRDALAHHCPAMPLLGMVPRDASLGTPSRHLGLALAGERDETTFLAGLADTIEQHVDIDALLKAITPVAPVRMDSAIPQACPPVAAPAAPSHMMSGDPLRHVSGTPHLAAPGTTKTDVAETPDAAGPSETSATTAPAPAAGPLGIAVVSRVPVAVARDEAFSFLYAENLALLFEAGMDVRFFSPLADTSLPEGVRGVLLPGGYPELHAKRLAANHAMRTALRDFAATGQPVHGECGGYMYLMDILETSEGSFPMSGCLPLRCRMDARLRALGYREATLLDDATFGSAGTTLRGHEYHYSHLVDAPAAHTGLTPLWQVRDRRGRDMGTEGWCCRAITGSYIHLHLASNLSAAHAFVAACA